MKALFLTDSLWLEIAVVSIVILLGHIFLGHFEERSPKWRKLLKYLIALALICAISVLVSRTAAFITLGVMFLPVVYIHAVLLPSKGINGWTGEPRDKYYEYRGWPKD
ncbi:MAG: hypothetical protein WA004_18580 [Saprospiraceae bacterium]